MSNPQEQSKASASSNQFLRKQYRKPKGMPIKRVAKKRVYKSRANVNSAMGSVRALNQRRQYIKVEDCTAQYAISLLDPTSEQGRGACIPTGFPMPSQKNRAYVRGTFNTGTTGDGFILFRPIMVNDQIALTFSGSASVGNASTAFSAYTNIASDNFSKLPFTTAQLVTNKEVAGRVVSACLRVRYAGTEASRAGLITTIEHPDHQNISGLSINDIGQFESAYRERPNPDGQWAQVNWSGPTQPREIEYVNDANASDSTIATSVLAIGVNGTAVNASYEYEAWINVEYIGKITTGKTLNKVDEQGYGNVLQSVKSVAGTKSLTPDASETVFSRLGNAMLDNMPQIVGVIGKGVNAFYPGSMIPEAMTNIFGQNPSSHYPTLMYH